MSAFIEEKDTAEMTMLSPKLSHIPSLRAVAALLALSLRQQIRGWRMIVLALLFMIPAGLVVLIKVAAAGGQMPPAHELNMAFIYVFIPNALAPLAALLCAGGLVRDDVEEQTLTYLLLRPLPRPALYAIKLLASMIITIALTVVFSAATFVLIDRLAGKPGDPDLAEKVIRVAMIFSVTQIAYCAFFGLMGLLMRRSLIIGVAYIVLFEGILAAFKTMARQLTVVFYFRVLVTRWLKPADVSVWSIDPADVPSATRCVLTLLIAAAILAAIGMLILSGREFRMKTPEGD
jgi:ABC-2 type transport system permease protein